MTRLTDGKWEDADDGLTHPTRADYMNGEVSHGEFYRAIAKTAGMDYTKAAPEFLESVRKALASGDEHLNTIPLASWDARGASLMGMPSVSAAFKAHGDYATLAGLVSLTKTAAIDAVA